VIAIVQVTGSDEPAANGGATSARLAETPPTSRARDRSSWIAEANAVCRLGHKLYPSIALGADTDPDTMDYAVHRLVEEIAAIPATAAAPARVRERAQRGQAVARAWRSLATRPMRDVTLRERRAAERLTSVYVDELVAAGASACARLRPAAA
jgi:hypothetical protein